MSRRARLLATMVALMVILAALAAAFDQVAKVPVLTHPLSGNDAGDTGAGGGSGDASEGISIADSIKNNTSGPLLQLIGVTGTSYLKLMAYEVGSDGNWIPLTGERQALSAGNTSVGAPMATDLMTNRSTMVRLLRDVTGPMPTFESTYRVCDPWGDLAYDPASGVIVSSSTGQPIYQLLHQQPTAASMSTLAALTCSSGEDLELPPQLAERLAELSDLVAGDLGSVFAQAMELARFLSSTYQLTGEDNGTISDFLFGDRSGDSKDFATAYTLLLRAQGIPARPCLTFRIDPNMNSQIVSPNSLAYAVEVNFDQLGWVMLNPNGMGTAGTLQGDGGVPPLNPIFPDMPLNLTGMYGVVFEDANSDGVMQLGESPVEDVGVQLLTPAGELLQTAQTNALGLYLFAGVGSGEYLIHLIAPEGSVMTTANDLLYSYSSGLEHAHDFGLRYLEPPEDRAPTRTDILSASPEIRKGDNFTVEGTCVAMPHPGSVEPIADGVVQIYLAASKEPGADRYCCGEGRIVEGYYIALCMTPTAMPAGNYQLIAYYLGDDEYEGSNSDPSVRVLDDTTLEMEVMNPAVAGASVLVNATLHEAVSGNGVAGATIAFDVIAPWGHSSLSAQTDGNGTARVRVPLLATGPVWVGAGFAGSSVLNASSDSRDFDSLPPEIILDGGSMVRAKASALIGRAMAGGYALPSVRVNISSDLGTYSLMTDAQGMFSLTITPPADTILGAHEFHFSVLQRTADLTVGVVSETQIAISYSNGVATLRLLDDKGAAIPDVGLTVTRSGSNSTVNTGSACLCDYRPTASGNHTVYFAGNQLYSSSLAYLNVDAAATAFPWWVVIVVVVAAGAVAAFLLLRRRGPQVVAPRRPEEPRGPYQIGFPQILHPLPQVWGADEPLKIAVQGRPGMVRLRVDGENGEDLDLSKGTAYCVRTLPRGTHRIDVEGPDGSSRAEVRIVDYREEVVVLYAGAFDSWRERGKVGASMTPREAMGNLTKEGTLPAARAEELVSTFEFAEFSLRPIGRADYERMFHAVAEASS